jgi:DNA-binding transcriptional MerR regulator
VADKEFETPQDALAHYGKKGMRWGVRNEDKPKGSDRSGSSEKPKESSSGDISKAMDSFYGKKDPADLQAEGQKKLEAQAKQSFPTRGAAREAKRADRADKIETKVAELDNQLAGLQRQRDNLSPGARTALKRMNLNSQINQTQAIRDDLQKKADQIRAGKLTDNQKTLIALGSAVAVTGLAVYGHRQYTLHKAGITSKDQKRLLEDNLSKTSDEWRTLFGDDHAFTKSGSHLTAGSGGFYVGLTNKKALSRPEFTIPKGTIFQRLSDHQEDSSDYGKVKGAYATFLNNDKKLYGASGEFGGKKYTVNFQAKGDVKVPNLTTVLAHLKQIEKAKNPDVTDETVFSLYHSMAGGSWSNPTARSLFDSLRTFGYGAIVDDMDAGYLGDLPVVFFGDAQPATSRTRTSLDKLMDSIGVLNTSGKYA